MVTPTCPEGGAPEPARETPGSGTLASRPVTATRPVALFLWGGAWAVVWLAVLGPLGVTTWPLSLLVPGCVIGCGLGAVLSARIRRQASPAHLLSLCTALGILVVAMKTFVPGEWTHALVLAGFFGLVLVLATVPARWLSEASARGARPVPAAAIAGVCVSGTVLAIIVLVDAAHGAGVPWLQRHDLVIAAASVVLGPAIVPPRRWRGACSPEPGGARPPPP
jgi:hypothetical protein